MVIYWTKLDYLDIDTKYTSPYQARTPKGSFFYFILEFCSISQHNGLEPSSHVEGMRGHVGDLQYSKETKRQLRFNKNPSHFVSPILASVEASSSLANIKGFLCKKVLLKTSSFFICSLLIFKDKRYTKLNWRDTRASIQ